jgi:hypothetical protein
MTGDVPPEFFDVRMRLRLEHPLFGVPNARWNPPTARSRACRRAGKGWRHPSVGIGSLGDASRTG